MAQADIRAWRIVHRGEQHAVLHERVEYVGKLIVDSDAKQDELWVQTHAEQANLQQEVVHRGGCASKLKQSTNCTTIMGEHTPADMVEIKVKDNELINVDGLKIRSIYTPGHTSESYSFLLNNYLFSGDALLINGTGRTDFQNGSSKDSYHSIFDKLLKLPEDTLLYPGHDYNGKKVSTIGNEKKFNPRLQVKNVDEYIEIMSNLNLSKPEMMDSNVGRNIQLGAN